MKKYGAVAVEDACTTVLDIGVHLGLRAGHDRVRCPP
jgi:hypothetical protein